MSTQGKEDNRGKCLQCGNRELHNYSCGYNINRPNGQSRVLDSEREQPKVLGTITQTNPDVLMLPVLRNGELIGKMSLRRDALPTDKPYMFSTGYRIEDGAVVVYETQLVECGTDQRFYPSPKEYLKRIVKAGIKFTQSVQVSERQTQLQPVSLDDVVKVASGECDG